MNQSLPAALAVALWVHWMLYCLVPLPTPLIDKQVIQSNALELQLIEETHVPAEVVNAVVEATGGSPGRSGEAAPFFATPLTAKVPLITDVASVAPGALAEFRPVILTSSQSSGEPAVAVRAVQSVENQDGYHFTSGPVVARQEPVRYPAAAIRNHIEGMVTLAIYIGREGRLDRVEVAQSSGNVLLDESAVAAARKSRYHAALSEGRPMPTKVLAPYSFHLESTIR